MGGMSGQVEGKTKPGTWIEFKKQMSKAGLLTKRDPQNAGLYVTSRSVRITPFEIMEEKPDGSGWALRYHFYT